MFLLQSYWVRFWFAIYCVLCCAVLRCAVLRCAVLCHGSDLREKSLALDAIRINDAKYVTHSQTQCKHWRKNKCNRIIWFNSFLNVCVMSWRRNDGGSARNRFNISMFNAEKIFTPSIRFDSFQLNLDASIPWNSNLIHKSIHNHIRMECMLER